MPWQPGAVLAVPVEAIDVVTGDTDIVSLGGGSHSGRSMRHSATLFAKAAPELIANGKRVAARLLDASVDQVTFADGRFSAPPHNRSFDFLELAKEAPRLGEGELAVTTDNDMHDPVFPNGCAVCEVEVDPETGLAEIARYSVVDDVGRCINPLIVHGQTHGGVAQGVGEAMWEECVVDPASGQPLSGSFMDYGMPRSNSLPFFTTRIVEVLSPTNPFGIKAGGEGGCTPALAVVISAILDALAPLGVRDMTVPATPFKVWTALRQPGHDVVLHGRIEDRSHDALAAAAVAGGVVSGDLSTIAGARTVADEVNKFGRFDAVIHNAGVGYREGRVEMEPRVPSVFAVKVLAPYILTALIERTKRLVYLSSGMHRGVRPRMDDLLWTKDPGVARRLTRRHRGVNCVGPPRRGAHREIRPHAGPSKDAPQGPCPSAGRRLRTGASGSQWTRRWSKADFELVVPPRPARGATTSECADALSAPSMSTGG